MYNLDKLSDKELEVFKACEKILDEQGHSGYTHRIIMGGLNAFIKNERFFDDNFVLDKKGLVHQFIEPLFLSDFTSERKTEIANILLRKSMGKPNIHITENGNWSEVNTDEKGVILYQNKDCSSVFMKKNSEGKVISLTDVNADIIVNLSPNSDIVAGWSGPAAQQQFPYLPPIFPKEHYYLDQDFVHPVSEEGKDEVYRLIVEYRWSRLEVVELNDPVLITKEQHEQNLADLAKIKFPFKPDYEVPVLLKRYLGLMGFNSTYLGEGKFTNNDFFKSKFEFTLSPVLTDDSPLLNKDGNQLYVVTLGDEKVLALPLPNNSFYLQCKTYNI